MTMATSQSFIGGADHSYQLFTALAAKPGFSGAEGLVLYRRDLPVAVIEGVADTALLVRFFLEAVDVPMRAQHLVLTASDLGALAREVAKHQRLLPALPFPSALIGALAFTTL